MISVIRYKSEKGKVPVTEWLDGLKDRRAKAKIALRFNRLASGNLGDHKAVSEGVSELRVTEGPGYRIYFGRHGEEVVVLLCGGDKSSQKSDIAKAKKLWTDWQQRQAKAEG